jgi:hypothetical protein
VVGVKTSYALGSRTGVQELRLRREVIVPASAGADALEIRTWDDREGFKVSEDGFVKVWDGSTFQNVLQLDRSVGRVRVLRGRMETGDSVDARVAGGVFTLISLADPRNAIIADAMDVRLSWGFDFLSARFNSPGKDLGYSATRDTFSSLYLTTLARIWNRSPASSTSPLVDSGPLILRGSFWDGVASRDRDASIIHRMLSTTPTSELAFQIAGVDYMRVGDRGVKLDKVVFDPGFSVSVDAGATYTLPAGTYYVNLGPNTVAEVYDDVAGTWVTVIPAGGKGIVVSDGSNARLRNTGALAEPSNMRRIL